MSVATRTASRVLPAPPDPVTVTNRAWFSSRRSEVISCCRPTKLVTATGRLCFNGSGLAARMRTTAYWSERHADLVVAVQYRVRETTMDDEKAQQISELLHEAAETHHRVYAIFDGDDSDWATWYADWLDNLSRLPGVLGVKPVRSELTYLL